MANHNWKGTVPSVPDPQRTLQKPNTYPIGNLVGSSSGSSFGSGVGKHLMGSVFDIGFDAASSWITGSINEQFAKRSEQRMDERNRKMLLDQPGLTAEGRRRAGLNPYGDASLPGMSGQSSIDSSPSSNIGKNRELMGLYFQEQLALEQLENDTIVAEATAAEKIANAKRISGQEGRDVEGWQYTLKMLENQSYNSDIERAFAYSNAFIDLLQKNQDLANSELNWWKIGAEIEHLYADKNYLDKKVEEIDRMFDHLDFQEQFQLLDLVSKFVLQENQFYYDTALTAHAGRIQARLQQDAQAHEKFMLGKSQEFNAEQNDANRNRQMWDSWIDLGAGALSATVGGLLIASGTGAAPGAALAAFGLDKMANTVRNWSNPPRRSIGY